MRIDHVRILEVVKAYEKTRVGSNGRHRDEENCLPSIRDEVIISTEAKRLMIRDRVVGQVVERLRAISPSHDLLPEVDAILEDALQGEGTAPLDSEDKAQIREKSLDRLRKRMGS